MKTEQIYQGLKELAEKLNITVSEKNLFNAGIKVKSGLCRVKDRRLFVMDRNKSLSKKVEILASCLAELPVDDVYMVPAIREMLDKYRRQTEGDDGAGPRLSKE